MTVSFAIRTAIGATVLLIGSSGLASAQVLQNVSPDPTQVYDCFLGDPIIVSGGTDPVSSFVTIVPDWGRKQPVSRILNADGTFTTHFPDGPAGSSTLMAPAVGGANYHIIVRAYRQDGTISSTKTIVVSVATRP